MPIELKTRSYYTSAAMVVPIMLRDEFIGLVSISSRDSAVRYRQEDLDALQLFAETASVYCRFAEQSEWMRQTIHTMDAALQTKKNGREREAA